jgi:hypothetical protein
MNKTEKNEVRLPSPAVKQPNQTNLLFLLQ